MQTTERTTPDQEKRDLEDLILILLCIILPPVAVFLKAGPYARFWVNILLTILGWIPGVVHAIWVVMTERNTPIGWYYKNKSKQQGTTSYAQGQSTTTTTTSTTAPTTTGGYGRTGYEATTVQPTGTGGIATTTTSVPTTGGAYQAGAYPSALPTTTAAPSPISGVKVPVSTVRTGMADVAVPPGVAKTATAVPSSSIPTTTAQ